MTHVLLTWNKWRKTQYLVSKQGGKRITGKMTCSRSAANALGLRKQHKTNGTCVADVEQTLIRSGNSAGNEITETMACSKESCKMHRNHANEMTPIVYILMILDRLLCSRSRCND